MDFSDRLDSSTEDNSVPDRLWPPPTWLLCYLYHFPADGEELQTISAYLDSHLLINKLSPATTKQFDTVNFIRR